MKTNNLNKDNVLKHISQLEITLNAIGLNELPKKNISSPFTEDKNPSFQIFNNGDFKCYSTGKGGDCFQLVAELNNLDCKREFNKVLEIVATKNNLLLQHNNFSLLNTNKSNKSNDIESQISVATSCNKLRVQKIELQKRHLDFWLKLGVTKELLIKYEVNAISSYSFFSEKKSKNLNFELNEKEIGFSYEVNSNIEVYIPKQNTKDKCFINSLKSDDIFGLQQVATKVECIIISAGKKDALTLIANGFTAVSFRSENQHITDEQFQKLQNSCNQLFICYDNDKAGENAQKRIIEKYPEIIPLQLPNDINDVADLFSMKGKDEFINYFDSLIKKGDPTTEKKETTTIFHIVEEYLNKKYDLRFNTIALEVEISEKNKNEWKSCNENSLWLELQKKSIKIPQNSLIAILKSNLITSYNPLLNYFENLEEWDKETDYITQFTKYLVLDEKEDREQLEYHFKKWCVRVVKCALIEDYFNKQAFVLTDEGDGQNIGKSSWCRFLCPKELTNYLAEDIGNDKDSRILLCKNFLINLDELAVLSRKEINQLKSYFSKDKINERLPYDRKNSIIPRVASFIGSTNMSTFLQDETGSVRWLCFVVKKIDWNYKRDFNIDNLWSQAYYLSKDKNFDETMSFEDIKLNEIRNDKFQISSPEKDFLYKFFEIPKNINEAEFLTSSEVINHISIYTSSGIRLNSIMMGKALKSLGFLRVKQNSVYGYWLKKKPV